MALLNIPMEEAPEDGNFVFVVDLDGEDFQLDFAYNAREDAWYFDILDIEGGHLRSGIKVVSNYPLLARWSEATAPAGEMYSFDTRPTPEDPALGDLGINSIFSYDQEEE